MRLYPFQKEGVEFLVKRDKALLADEMGLGKTVQAIAAMAILKPSSVAIVCPATLVTNWQREIAAFAPEILPLVTILSYNKVSQLDGFYDVLIVDESHYIKNIKAQRTKLVLSLAKRCERVWFLSGTPITNTIIDAHTVFSFLDSNKFPLNFWHFANRFASPIKTRWSWEFPTSLDKTSLFNSLTPSVMLRRKKEQVLKELPAKIHSTRYIEAEKIQEINELGETVDLDDLEGSGISHVTLRRLLAHGKVSGALEVIEEILQEKRKLVVFGYFAEPLKTLTKQLVAKGYNTVQILGDTPSTARDEAVQTFQNNDDCRVFVGNIIAAGVGITLTAADTVLFLERDWTPANNRQAEDRIHRIGQENCCQIIDLVVADSIDEQVIKVLIYKQKTIGEAIDGTSRENTQTNERESVEETLTLPWELGA